jgi:hypothetical protein
VLIQDEVGPEVAGTIVWSVHTSAEPVSMARSVARFRMGDDRFVVRILEPEGARFELGFPPEPRSFSVADVRQLHGLSLPAGDAIRISELPRRADDKGKRAAGPLIRRLQIVWPRGTRRLSVLFLPDYDGDDSAPLVTPLNEWLARRPVRLAQYPQSEYWTHGHRDAEGAPPVDAGLLAALPAKRDARARGSL